MKTTAISRNRMRISAVSKRRRPSPRPPIMPIESASLPASTSTSHEPLTTWTTSAVTASLVVLGIIHTPSLAAVHSVAWQMIYLTFVGVLLAMLAWNTAIQRIGGLNATLFINCMPVVTFAYRAVQGHRFETIELVGAGLVVSALIANNLYLRQEQRRLAGA